MPSANPKSERLYIRLTPSLYESLSQMMTKGAFPSMSDAGREAIRYYVDNQTDEIGSRRHFSRTMQQRLNELEDFVHAHSAVQTYLLAQAIAQQMTLLEQIAGAMSEGSGQPRRWKGSELLSEATRIAVQQQSGLRATVDKMCELIDQQRDQATTRKSG